MPTKRCSWGTCNSDSRYKDKDYMQNVSFHAFPKPTADLERCRLWIKQCGRPHSDLSVDKIRPHHFVCSKVRTSDVYHAMLSLKYIYYVRLCCIHVYNVGYCFTIYHVQLFITQENPHQYFLND